MDVAKVFSQRLNRERGFLDIPGAIEDLKRLNRPEVVLDEALGHAARSLRPWRIFLLQTMRELAARGEMDEHFLWRLWEHAVASLEVFGEEEIEKTLVALSHSTPGCNVLVHRVVPALFTFYNNGDPRADWSWWVVWAAGLLGERNVKLPKESAGALAELIDSHLDEERMRDARPILEFHLAE